MSIASFFLDLIYPPKCKFCGASLEREIWEPCPKCRKAPFWLEGAQGVFDGKHFARCVCAGWYQGALRDQVLAFKFSDRPQYARAYGPVLARQVRLFLPGTYDVITWVPVSRQTLKKRGYDQARLLAEETARALGRELEDSPCEHRLVILLSDAKPNDVIKVLRDGTYCDYADEVGVLNTAMEVRSLLHRDIAVICVFTGDDEDLPAAHTIYGRNFARIRSLEQFADTVGTLIQNQIRGFGS